jgi:hypothetical protein
MYTCIIFLQMATRYEPAGVKGTAPSTENVRKSASVFFGDYGVRPIGITN